MMKNRFNINSGVSYYETYKAIIWITICVLAALVLGVALFLDNSLLLIPGFIGGGIVGLVKLYLTYNGVKKMFDDSEPGLLKGFHFIMNITGYGFMILILVLAALRDKHLMIGCALGIFVVYFAMLLVVIYQAIVGERTEIGED